MAFGDALREFLEMAEVKQIQLAEYLGYDVSYINKWISGQKQPSVRNNKTLFLNIAEFIVKHGGDELRQNFASLGVENNFEEYIVEKLSSGYAKPEAKKAKSSTHVENNCYMGEMGDVYTINTQRMKAAFISAFSSEQDRFELITIPQLIQCGHSEVKNQWEDISSMMAPGKMLHVRFGIDLSDPEMRMRPFRDVLTFLFGVSDNITFDIYPVDSFHKTRQGIYVFQNVLCMVMIENALMQDQSVIVSYDPQFVNSYYSAAENHLYPKQKLVDQESFDSLYARKYFMSFLLNKEFNALHTVMPMIYMEEQLLCDLCIKHGIEKTVAELYSFYERGIDRWTNIIYKSAFMKFLFDGSIWMLGSNLVLSPEERKQYFENMLQAMERGSKLFIINDVNPVINRTDIHCSIYFNGKNMFSVRHCEGNREKSVLHANDEALMDCFKEFFDSLTTMPNSFSTNGKNAYDFIRQCISLI